MKLLDIGEVAAQSGLPASTLRYYEEQRLIACAGRHGLRRQYEPGVLQRLALINLARSAGFSLDEIAALFGQGDRMEIPRDDLQVRAQELEHRAQGMMALASMMRHVADCPAPSHLECPTFQKLLRIGTRHQSRARRQRKRKATELFVR
jgi:DNA-binding transcriptional MerR regulator